MKKELLFSEFFKEIPIGESILLTGGGFIDTMYCIRGTLTGNITSAVKTMVYGGTIWGMARLAGVIAGCSH
jgi:hypothetical protein